MMILRSNRSFPSLIAYANLFLFLKILLNLRSGILFVLSFRYYATREGLCRYSLEILKAEVPTLARIIVQVFMFRFLALVILLLKAIVNILLEGRFDLGLCALIIH